MLAHLSAGKVNTKLKKLSINKLLKQSYGKKTEISKSHENFNFSSCHLCFFFIC